MSAQLEATRRAARHRQGLALLARAGIEGDAVPGTFDGAALMDELEHLERRHTINSVVTHPPATKKPRRQANAIVSAAKRMAVGLREVLKEDGSPVPTALADAMGRPNPDWFPHGLAGHERLRLLLAELTLLAEAEKPVQAKIGSFEQKEKNMAAFWPAANGITAWVELLARDLPALYTKALSRQCTTSWYSGSRAAEPKASECLRFIKTCAAECGVTVEPDAILVAMSRWRKPRTTNV